MFGAVQNEKFYTEIFFLVEFEAYIYYENDMFHDLLETFQVGHACSNWSLSNNVVQKLNT